MLSKNENIKTFSIRSNSNRVYQFKLRKQNGQLYVSDKKRDLIEVRVPRIDQFKYAYLVSINLDYSYPARQGIGSGLMSFLLNYLKENEVVFIGGHLVPHNDKHEEDFKRFFIKNEFKIFDDYVFFFIFNEPTSTIPSLPDFERPQIRVKILEGLNKRLSSSQ